MSAPDRPGVINSKAVKVIEGNPEQREKACPF
jgi:hypothetical protein